MLIHLIFWYMQGEIKVYTALGIEKIGPATAMILIYINYSKTFITKNVHNLRIRNHQRDLNCKS